MKITDIQATVLKGNFHWPIVKVKTDEGVHGYGEMRNHFPPECGMDAHSVPKDLAIALKPLLVGEDPTDPRRIWRKVADHGGRGRAGGGVSAVEAACWDIAGKAAGQPVWQLLGGKCRDIVEVYCDCRAGRPVIDCVRDYVLDDTHYTPEAYAANARHAESLGFKLIKFDLFGDVTTRSVHVASLVDRGMDDGFITDKGIEYEAGLLGAACEAVGPETRVAVDCAVYGSVDEAIRFGRAVEDLELAWLEDLLPDADVDGWRRVTDAVGTPTLAGENIYTAAGFEPLLAAGAIRIAAADLMTVGGLGEALEVGRLAAKQGVPVAPHFAGSPVGMMANLHASATLPGLVAQEFHAVGVPWWETLIVRSDGSGSLIQNGTIKVPNSPGLGFELDEDACRQHLAPGERFFE